MSAEVRRTQPPPQAFALVAQSKGQHCGVPLATSNLLPIEPETREAFAQAVCVVCDFAFSAGDGEETDAPHLRATFSWRRNSWFFGKELGRGLKRTQFLPMRKALSLVFAVFAAFVVTLPPRCHAGESVALDVDLSGMYSVDLQSFIRAVVPEVSGGHAEKPLELNKLLSVYRFFLQSSYISDGRDTNGDGRIRETLERLIREKIGKLDLTTLRRMALGNEKAGRGDSLLLAALYQRVIQSEVARVVASPKLKPAFSDNAAQLPEWFPASSAPADTALLRKAAGPFLELLTKMEGRKMRGLHADGGGMGVLSDSFWRRPEIKVANDLLQIEWDSDCGNGMESFETDRIIMVFIGLLREKRIAEALGASFVVPFAPDLIREPNQPFERWRIDLLKFCGFDWEAVMLGLNRGNSMLAAHGSERGAKHLVSASRRRMSGRCISIESAKWQRFSSQEHQPNGAMRILAKPYLSRLRPRYLASWTEQCGPIVTLNISIN